MATVAELRRENVEQRVQLAQLAASSATQAVQLAQLVATNAALTTEVARLNERLTEVLAVARRRHRVDAAGKLVLVRNKSGNLPRGHLRRRPDPLDRLTPREWDVLRLMAEGRSNSGIAAALRETTWRPAGTSGGHTPVRTETEPGEGGSVVTEPGSGQQAGPRIAVAR